MNAMVDNARDGETRTRRNTVIARTMDSPRIYAESQFQNDDMVMGYYTIELVEIV